MPSSLADLLHAGHGVVEVAGDLHRQRAVVERLRKLAVGDLARADEDHRLHQLASTAQYMASDALVLPVEAQAARLAPIVRACVKAADMPLSLKLPEGFIPSYCRYSRPGLHADELRHAVGLLQERLPFADRDDRIGRGERQQLVEPPHAAEAAAARCRRDHICSK